MGRTFSNSNLPGFTLMHRPPLLRGRPYDKGHWPDGVTGGQTEFAVRRSSQNTLIGGLAANGEGSRTIASCARGAFARAGIVSEEG